MIIDSNLLCQLSSRAKSNPRLRMNYNLHDSLDANAQRLLNALELGTKLPIHRHRNTSETYILLRGKIDVLFYDEIGIVVQRFHLDPLEGNFGVHIPKGQWHTLEVQDEWSVIFEVKDGPYTPLEKEDVMELETK